MLLATTQVEDFDRFMEVFSTERRGEAQAARLEGRAGLPRPVRERPGLGDLRLGRAGLAELRVRPGGPPIMEEAGHKGKPQAAQFAGRCDA